MITNDGIFLMGGEMIAFLFDAELLLLETG